MSLEFGRRKSFEGISGRRETGENHLEDYKRRKELERMRENERTIRKSRELFEFGRFGIEGLGKETDEGIYGAYPLQNHNKSFAEEMGDSYANWAQRNKEINAEELKKTVEEIDKLLWEYYDAYVSNELSKKNEICTQIMFYERVRKDVSIGVPLTVAKELEKANHNVSTITDEDIKMYDEIMEQMKKRIEARIKSLREEYISLEKADILKQLEYEYKKLLEEYKKALESDDLETKLRLMHEMKKIQVQQEYIRAGKSEEEAQQHANSLVFFKSTYLKAMDKFDLAIEARKKSDKLREQRKEMRDRWRSSFTNPRQKFNEHQVSEIHTNNDNQNHTSESHDNQPQNLQEPQAENKIIKTNDSQLQPDTAEDDLDKKEQLQSFAQVVGEVANQTSEYEKAKRKYKEVSASKELIDQINSKPKEEIDADLNDFETEENIILNSKHFTEEQKKKLIDDLYSEFDEYVEKNPEISRRQM